MNAEPIRCPFCFKVPTFHRDARDQWHGGCSSGIEALCSNLENVAYQPSYEFAVSQWNYIVRPLAESLYKGKVA